MTAAAAEAAPPAAAPESDLGKPYVKDVSGDWEIHCIHTDLSNDPCTLHQTLRDPNGSAVATIEIVNIPNNQQLAAGVTVVTPLDTLLTEQVALSIDIALGVLHRRDVRGRRFLPGLQQGVAAVVDRLRGVAELLALTVREIAPHVGPEAVIRFLAGFLVGDVAPDPDGGRFRNKHAWNRHRAS